MSCEPLKQPFFDLTHVGFWDGQEAENELKVSCDTLILHFLDITQVAFWVSQEEEKSSQ